MGDEIEYFARTQTGKLVSGRGKNGLDSVIGAIVFDNLRALLREIFEDLQQLLQSRRLPSGCTVEAEFGVLGLESVILFRTTSPRQPERFEDFDAALWRLEEMPGENTPDGTIPGL